MSKKLSGNGFWESSRMMLPEHKEKIISYQTIKKIKSKPELSDEEVETINMSIVNSYNRHVEVSVTIFGEINDRVISGYITRIDRYGKKFRVEIDMGFEWIDFNEVLSVKVFVGEEVF